LTPPPRRHFTAAAVFSPPIFDTLCDFRWPLRIAIRFRHFFIVAADFSFDFACHAVLPFAIPPFHATPLTPGFAATPGETPIYAATAAMPLWLLSLSATSPPPYARRPPPRRRYCRRRSCADAAEAGDAADASAAFAAAADAATPFVRYTRAADAIRLSCTPTPVFAAACAAAAAAARYLQLSIFFSFSFRHAALLRLMPERCQLSPFAAERCCHADAMPLVALCALTLPPLLMPLPP